MIQLRPDPLPVRAKLAALHGALCSALDGYAVSGPRHAGIRGASPPLVDLGRRAADGAGQVGNRFRTGSGKVVIESHGRNSEAIATDEQVAIAFGAPATVGNMTDGDAQEHRRARLRALIASEPYQGNLSSLGRALGYKDGVFVRQMRDGDRPISEKTIARIESIPGLEGWFTGNRPTPIERTLSPTALRLAIYFDRRATPQEQELITRMIPVDIDLTVPGFPDLGGMSNFGELDETGSERKK